MLEAILHDVIDVMIEQGQQIDIEEMEETLRDLAEHPIDLNSAYSDDLARIPWLSPDQIESIRLYTYYHPMKSVYELQLIYGLKDWEIRNLLPFVTVVPANKKDNRTIADLMRYAKHEVDLRVDARNIEDFTGDPMYASVKYKLNAANRIQAGIVLKRDAGELYNEKSRYGAYLELCNIWRFQTIVAGDYKANFGLGLIMNSSLPLGKSSNATNLGYTSQGLRKYNGTSDSFLRGAGATLRLGDWRVSGFYSYRQPDSIYRQTAGVNVTYQKKSLRIGATLVDYWVKDSVPLRDNYYNGNYFRGTNQLAVSVDAQYAIKNVFLMAEVAAAQNTKWGAAALTGVRYSPVQDVSLLALYRYYSDMFDPHYGTSFSETTRLNDEQGAYLGADITRLRYWRFSVYSDFFWFKGPKYMIRESGTWGYDLMGQIGFMKNEKADLRLRARIKHKGEKDNYQFRYLMTNSVGSISLRTELDYVLCRRPDINIMHGGMVAEQIEYRPSRVPLVGQLRVEGFYVPDWDNRIYSYENDVLYAFSIPAMYGIGVRYYANLRYRINDHYSLYLKASDTWYCDRWVAEKQLRSNHKTDVHLMLRISY